MNYLLAEIYWEENAGLTIDQKIEVTPSAYRLENTILYYFESDLTLDNLENYNSRIVDSQGALEFAQSCIPGSTLEANGLIDSPRIALGLTEAETQALVN